MELAEWTTRQDNSDIACDLTYVLEDSYGIMEEQMSGRKDLDPRRNSQLNAYIALSAIFDKYCNLPKTLIIEILPPSIVPPQGELYLEDEVDASVGIPKKILVAAFLRARSIFSRRQEENLSDEVVLTATSIILLYDPEYITAANFRKQRLRCIQQETRSQLIIAIENEIKFLDCVLTSPLHRQTKSPTLWYHRLWIHKIKTDKANVETSKETITAEYTTILRAAEHHQHNYYAFQYGRRLYDLLTHRKDFSNTSDVLTALSELVRMILTWCKEHPADTSGWSFLLFLLQKSKEKHGELFSAEVIDAVLPFTEKLDWKGEALWAFLRTINAQPSLFLTEETRLQTLGRIEDLSTTLSPFHASKLEGQKK